MKKIMSFTLVLMLMLSAVSVFSTSALTLFDYKKAFVNDCIGTGDKKHEQEFLKITKLNDYCTPSEGNYFYQPLYEYYSNGEENLTDESTPDYVLVYAGGVEAGPMYANALFGDYVLQTGGVYSPYDLGYCIYIPGDSKVLSLEKAYEEQLPGIENVFTEYGMGWLLGDVDMDRKLTIKDATDIQKYLVGIHSFSGLSFATYDDSIVGLCIYADSNDNIPKYISDFNRDGERNIKDATAIQKCIAGLEY
ncbi:MAG: hypothetical protein IJ298_09000 [Ruminococcus sp.]|nr:hypothetical protein [Ruminococcus sp.]